MRHKYTQPETQNSLSQILDKQIAHIFSEANPETKGEKNILKSTRQDTR